jgi:hypothetical protein
LLIGGRRTAPTRQQTLRATLNWSYGLLADQERVVFRRLGVFAADCGLDAAEAVCATSDLASGDVLAVLQRLVDKSLVMVDEKSSRARYRLLEPVRQYAHGKLATRGELGEVRQRHALFYLAFGEQRERAANVGGPERPAATAALLQEYSTIRLALGRCLESSRPPRVRCACWQLAVSLECWATCRPQAHFYEAGLPLATTIGDPWVQWLGPQNFGVYARSRGDFETATRSMREALAIAQAHDDRIDEAITLGALAWAAWLRADYGETEIEQVLDRLLAEVVVDSEDG